MSTISKKHFYAVQGSNTLAVSIAVGDCVLVLASTQNSGYISGLADNGSGGGNAYTLYNQNSNCGFTSMYYCNYATKAATSISFTSTSSMVFMVVTYSNSTGVPIKIGLTANSGNSGSGGSTISTGSLTTTSPNSVLVSLLSWWNASSGVSISATSGTLEGSVAPSVVAGVLVGMGVIDQACATVGGYTNSASTSGGNASYQGTWSIELIPLTINNYLGEVAQAQVHVPIKFWDIPSYAGSAGGGSPVTPVPVGIVLKGGTVGVSYSEAITAQGGTSPYTYTLQSGSLPTGCTISSSGNITGTPSAAGTYSFTVKVTDALTNTGTQNFQITIASPSYTLEEYGQVLHDAVVGTAYSETLSVTGGTGPYTWSLASGSLPTGLSLSSSGVISGTPSAAGTFTFAVTVTDSGSVTQTITFTIAAATPAASGGGSWVF